MDEGIPDGGRSPANYGGIIVIGEGMVYCAWCNRMHHAGSGKQKYHERLLKMRNARQLNIGKKQ